MKFSEIANRLTDISTPFGGASWQPAETEITAARRVIALIVVSDTYFCSHPLK